jgi:SAM-dependent methyltransferase
VITGVDIAAEFIDEAKAACPEGRWVEGEMTDLPWSDAFDGAYCWGNSFGYLDDRGNTDFLRAVYRTLKPGARFALHSGTMAETTLFRLEPQATHQAGDVTMHVTNHYDAANGRLETAYTFARGGVEQHGVSSQRVYSLRELIEQLADVGFAVESAWGGRDRRHFGLGSPELILVAAKPT